MAKQASCSRNTSGVNNSWSKQRTHFCFIDESVNQFKESISLRWVSDCESRDSCAIVAKRETQF